MMFWTMQYRIRCISQLIMQLITGAHRHIEYLNMFTIKFLRMVLVKKSL